MFLLMIANQYTALGGFLMITVNDKKKMSHHFEGQKMYTIKQIFLKCPAYCKLPFLKTNHYMLAVNSTIQYRDLAFAWQIVCGENMKTLLSLAYLFFAPQNGRSFIILCKGSIIIQIMPGTFH